MVRKRLDVILVEREVYASREQARSAVLAGEVTVEGRVEHKAGAQVDDSALIEVASRRRFVSRGGDKLAGALADFPVVVAGRRAIDVGASTGGFTDCLLQEGATGVVALDVGYGQLAWSLRTDERVTVVERTNIRTADPAGLGAPFDIVVADVSFISLGKVLDHLVALLGEDGDLLMLVKPQFEAGKTRVGKRGVVKDPTVHADVLESVVRECGARGLVVRGLSTSPIKGPEGNIEFWLWASRHGDAATVSVTEVVSAAHMIDGGAQ